MASSYKTPGVYLEEIVKFPPSVAQVETAIPAFIGYTQKATNKIKGDLKSVPTRITSLLEYETYFGKAKPETSIQVTINDKLVNGVEDRTIVVDQPSTRQPFLMYYSMQMYFANGGGPCYIVSAGRYGDSDDLDETDTQITSSTTAFADFKKGLGLIEKVDEVTLIVFPDATSIADENEFYSLYNDGLTQCFKLQDRFTIIDTKSYDASSPTDANIGGLRGIISNDKDYRKYGAAYYPFLKTILNYHYNKKDVVINHISETAGAYHAIKANLGLLDDPATGLEVCVGDIFSPPAALPGNITGSLTSVLMHMYSATGYNLADAFATNDTIKSTFLTLAKSLNDDLKKLTDHKTLINTEAKAASGAVKDENPAIATLIDTALQTFNNDFVGANKIDEVFANLKELLEKMKNADTDTKENNLLNTNALNFDTELKKLALYTPLTAITDITAVDVNAFANIVSSYTALGVEIEKIKDIDKNNGALHLRNLGNVEFVDNATYNKIITEINSLPLELPPSSAMAGIYARVDANLGVWKAPANVSLNYVIEPSLQVTHDDQKDLNEPTSGKSINAIRAFTGKGILVWGARTLAGNDNEWRYISVRRFFNMAEESIKKASEQFVFEPNDKNTWVRVKAMIDNYLTNLWKAGALAGPTPEKAFYVNVGLGETMTSQDILEGKMIIEIGMAAVRPAEFIILRFSHKMQEA